MSRYRATLVGFTAVLMWSLLALFTVATAPVPPFLLTALTFAIGGAIGLVWVAAGAGFGVLRAVPLRIYAFGTAGLFGYHALYFAALRLAPPAEAGLVAYLWPLLIVLLSGLLPGERLRPMHLVGAALAFSGAALLVLRGGGTGVTAGAAPGLALAFLCALTWATYSVVSRGLGRIPTESVAVFCLATAAMSALAHLLLEETALPTDISGWSAVIALGVGPVGLAFFVWDIGMKRGDIQMLGVAAYAAPLLSTVTLVLAGVAPATPVLGIAALLITGGALLAARASSAKGDVARQGR